MSIMKEMLSAGVHFGHRKASWNPEMEEYIFGINHGIHIINLEKTIPLFQDAINFIGKIVSNGGRVLFVGTKKQAQDIVKSEAKRCGMPYVSHRWLGGMLTNYKTVRQSIKRLAKLKKMQEDGALEPLIKKERLRILREIQKLEKFIGGIKDMGGIPDAILVIDTYKERIAIQEAQKLGIKIIAVADTNSNLRGVDYIIPGNDDAVKSISFYMKKFAEAVINAQGLDITLKDRVSEIQEIQ